MVDHHWFNLLLDCANSSRVNRVKSMAKLFFYYSTMNAGKSTNLLQASFNYKEQGFNTILFNYHNDKRLADGKVEQDQVELYVTSRLGVRERANPFNQQTDLQAEVQRLMQGDLLIKDDKGNNAPVGAVLIDEAQFLTKEQVRQLSDIVDYMNIPVLCYGIRTDFLGNPFEGSIYLLAWADELVEFKTICKTGKKATFVLRLDEQGNPQTSGDLEVIGSLQYYPVSRKMHKIALRDGKIPTEK